jgi:hypothetical protein
LSNQFVGEPAEFVDTQGFSLKLKSATTADTIEYRQVLSLVPANIDHQVFFHQLTDNTVEKTFALTDAAFEVKMMLTIPELGELILLASPVNAELAKREWTVTLTSVSATVDIVGGDAIISHFSIIDAGVGLATIEMTLDFVTGATLPATAGVQVLP